MSSVSKVEFLPKLVKVKDGLASDVVEKSESKGRSRRSDLWRVKVAINGARFRDWIVVN